MLALLYLRWTLKGNIENFTYRVFILYKFFGVLDNFLILLCFALSFFNELVHQLMLIVGTGLAIIYPRSLFKNYAEFHAELAKLLNMDRTDTLNYFSFAKTIRYPYWSVLALLSGLFLVVELAGIYPAFWLKTLILGVIGILILIETYKTAGWNEKRIASLLFKPDFLCFQQHFKWQKVNDISYEKIFLQAHPEGMLIVILVSGEILGVLKKDNMVNGSDWDLLMQKFEEHGVQFNH